MTIAYIGLGSNLEHPRRQLAKAVQALRRLPRSRVTAVSGSYVTAPVGTRDEQPDYVNAVVEIHTSLAPRALLSRLNAIERRQHRRRSVRNAPRTLDLDLLLFGGRRIDLAHLTVPHPRMHERAFVLRPLVDIAPSVNIPKRGLAQRYLREARGQRIRRTRTHVI